jgi:hypothetical protein
MNVIDWQHGRRLIGACLISLSSLALLALADLALGWQPSVLSLVVR